jgi:signal peptidase I
MAKNRSVGDAKERADKTERGFFRETFSTVFWAIAIAFVLRTFLFQPFHIPSGSMEPNLVTGDYIITTKYSVGYGKYAASPLPFPVKKGRLFERDLKRGDVIVFRHPRNKKNIIKRLVGLPGDQIKMSDGVLYINGKPNKMTRKGQTERLRKNGSSETAEIWSETLPEGKEYLIYDVVKNGRFDDTSIQTVPAGYYFFMGDNRDRSGDSREDIGYVPAENIMGRAEFVLLSVTPKFSLFKPWTWGHMRGDRFFKGLR